MKPHPTTTAKNAVSHAWIQAAKTAYRSSG
jgi:hypothetical protein